RQKVLTEVAQALDDEAANNIVRSETCSDDMVDEFCYRAEYFKEAAGFVRALAHTDAGKVEGRSDLERFWRPIAEADKSITFQQAFDIGGGETMTIRNSDEYWVRDDDGRVY